MTMRRRATMKQELDVRIEKNIPMNVESGEDYKDDFGHAMFFVKYLCHVEE
jgi:hypothetical protein